MPVAQKEPNGFGLYDVSGNAYEWTNDRFAPSGYGHGPLTDPMFGLDDPSDLTPSTPVFEGASDSNDVDGFPGFRMQRGGAFDLWSVLAASGRPMYASVAVQDSGFRLARTVPATPNGRDQ
jgi:formylglycine-generating enzyme required for sulfatase activity